MSEAFLSFVDLASERLGASVVSANDEFFGEKDRLIATEAPVWKEGLYTDRGKWMDGWETRRRREPGHDWAIVRLGAPGVVHGLDVETTYFKGNYPEGCAVDVCYAPGLAPAAWTDAAWSEVLPQVRLKGDAHNVFPVHAAPRASHLRLRIFPDGGVARLRVYGEVVPDWHRLRGRGQIDLAAVEHGGIVVASSDMFFGHRHNLIMPGDARTMGEGWETRRRRGGGHDWTIVRLGAPGTIERAEVDTRHFKGNAPGACSLEGCVVPARHPAGDEVIWQEMLPRTPLQPDARRTFEDEIVSVADVSYVRLNIFPDGGRTPPSLRAIDVTLADLNRLTESRAEAEFAHCCGSIRWAHLMAAERPFTNRQVVAAAAQRLWWSLEAADWLEAFAAHPRIGEPATSAWSAQEQAGAASMTDLVRERFARGNHEYEARFGYTFLICATGKSADEILEALERRLHNKPGDELQIAADEQRKITDLRLMRLVTP